MADSDTVEQKTKKRTEELVQNVNNEMDRDKWADEIDHIATQSAYGSVGSFHTTACMKAGVRLATPKDSSNPSEKNELMYKKLNEKWMTYGQIERPEIVALNRELVEKNVSYAVDDALNRLKENDNNFDKTLKYFVGAKNSIVETPRIGMAQNFSQNVEQNVFKTKNQTVKI